MEFVAICTSSRSIVDYLCVLGGWLLLVERRTDSGVRAENQTGGWCRAKP